MTTHLDTHPGWEVELAIAVETQDGVKVTRGPVKEVFSVLQGVGVTDLLQTCDRTLVTDIHLTVRYYDMTCGDMGLLFDDKVLQCNIHWSDGWW